MAGRGKRVRIARRENGEREKGKGVSQHHGVRGGGGYGEPGVSRDEGRTFEVSSGRFFQPLDAGAAATESGSLNTGDYPGALTNGRTPVPTIVRLLTSSPIGRISLSRDTLSIRQDANDEDRGYSRCCFTPFALGPGSSRLQ